VIGTSEAFQAAVRGPHTAVCKVEVVRDGAVVATLDVHDGSVDADRSAAQLRRFTAEVADPRGELTPRYLRDMLTPFGTQVRLFRGVLLPGVRTVSHEFAGTADWVTGLSNNIITTGDGALELG